MKSKYFPFGIFLSVLLAVGVVLVFIVYNNSREERAQDIDVEAFEKIGYTNEELMLFSDIAFRNKSERIRKWETDIKVEVKNLQGKNSESITEVDSIISILAPLIAPLKIERVKKNGNLIVYRGVTYAPVSVKSGRVKYLNGLSRVNEPSRTSWDIYYASIYHGNSNGGTQTLMHEFEHALGLDHPIKIYPFYVTIGRSVIPSGFVSDPISSEQAFYISEQEKTVIRMLYSNSIKPGLRRLVFEEKMGL